MVGSSRARDRILDVADDLFHRQGIHETGVNLLVERSGVAKATFYKHFASKAALVDAYLARRHTQLLADLAAIDQAGVGAPDKVDAVFGLLSGHVGHRDFRGCAFVVAATEMPGGDPVARRWAREHKNAVLDVLRTFLRGEVAEPAEVAEQLLVVYDGTLVVAAVRHEVEAVQRARRMARTLLDTARL